MWSCRPFCTPRKNTQGQIAWWCPPRGHHPERLYVLPPLLLDGEHGAAGVHPVTYAAPHTVFHRISVPCGSWMLKAGGNWIIHTRKSRLVQSCWFPFPSALRNPGNTLLGCNEVCHQVFPPEFRMRTNVGFWSSRIQRPHACPQMLSAPQLYLPPMTRQAWSVCAMQRSRTSAWAPSPSRSPCFRYALFCSTSRTLSAGAGWVCLFVRNQHLVQFLPKLLMCVYFARFAPIYSQLNFSRRDYVAVFFLLILGAIFHFFADLFAFPIPQPQVTWATNQVFSFPPPKQRQ